MDQSSSAVPGTAAYNTYLKEELAAQDARKSSFEQRGLAVITTSGALVTLLFALAALSTKAKPTYELPSGATTFLTIALVLFLLAALFGLVTNYPLRYEAVEADEVRQRLRESPVRAEVEAERDVALTRVKALRDAKKKNGYKGGVLFVAMSLEVVAAGSLGVAIWLVLNS